MLLNALSSSKRSIHIHIGVRGRNGLESIFRDYTGEPHKHPEVSLSLIASYCGAKSICALVTCHCMLLLNHQFIICGGS